jgi:hypothetical protein
VSAVVEEQGDGSDGSPTVRGVRAEPRWPVAVVVAGAVGLQVVLPGAFTPGHRLVPVLELVLLVGLVVANPGRLDTPGRWLRRGSVALVGMITVTNAWSAVRLVQGIITGTSDDAIALLSSGAAIWETNVVVFGLWYWELDRGGPGARAQAMRPRPDFVFPQMTSPELAHPDWEPGFGDYLYLALTNATAFSPTDTLPFSRWSKLAMGIQSLVSLSVGALIVARAVNILG